MITIKYSAVLLVLSLTFFAMSCRLKKNSTDFSGNHTAIQTDMIDSQIIKNNSVPDSKTEIVEIKKINFDTVLFASISKTNCYGNCPHFEIRCYESGLIIYEGFANVKLNGKYEARIDTSYKSDLRKKIIECKFLELEDKYPVNGKTIVDFPLTVCGYFENDLNKVIYNRHEAPSELLFYERFFVEFFENLDWKPRSE